MSRQRLNFVPAGKTHLLLRAGDFAMLVLIISKRCAGQVSHALCFYHTINEKNLTKKSANTAEIIPIKLISVIHAKMEPKQHLSTQ